MRLKIGFVLLLTFLPPVTQAQGTFQILPPTEVSAWLFGSETALSASGSTLLVGVTSAIEGFPIDNYIAAYVFTLDPHTPTSRVLESAALSLPVTRFTPPPSVALSADGRTAILGNLDGALYRFRLAHNGWIPEVPLRSDAIVAPPNQPLQQTLLLSADGSLLAVGVPGAVHFFRLGTAGDSFPVGKDPSNYQLRWTLPLGDAVSLSRKAIALSSNGECFALRVLHQPGGMVHLYRKNAADIWMKEAELQAPASGKTFGTALALSASCSTLAVESVSSTAHAVHLYNNRKGSWINDGEAIIGQPKTNHVEASLSLSDDGSVLLAGLPYDLKSVCSTGRTGHSYLFRREETSDPSGTSYSYRLQQTLPGSASTFGERAMLGAGMIAITSSCESAIYLYPSTSPVHAESPDRLPAGFQLRDVYPNPSHGRVTLEYAVRERQDVAVLVYDVLGRQVHATMLGGQSPGFHSHALDLHGLAAGPYLLRLRTGDASATRMLFVADE